MKFTSYWLDTAPQGSLERSKTTVEGRTEVAVIGGGLTGVVAALHLARTWSEGAPVRAAHRGVRRLRSQRRHGDHRHVDRHQGRSGQARLRDRSAAVRRLHRGDRPRSRSW